MGKEILIALNNGIRIAGSILASATVPDVLVDVQMLFHEHFENDEAFLEKLRKGLPKRTQIKSSSAPSYGLNEIQRYLEDREVTRKIAEEMNTEVIKRIEGAPFSEIKYRTLIKQIGDTASLSK